MKKASGGSVFRRHDDPSCPPIGTDGKRPEHRCKGRWTGTLELGPQGGKRRRVTFFGHTQREVREKLAEAQRRHDSGVPVRDSRTPLSVYVDHWMATTLDASDRKRSTKATYRALLNTHVVTDSMALRPLGRIGPTDIESFVIRMRDKGLADSTIRQIHIVIRQVLATAVRDHLISANPAAQVRRPALRTKEADSLTPGQVALLLKSASGSRYEPLMRLLVSTGLRKGEALALHWSDVDLENGYLSVRATLSRSEGRLQLDAPKTERSRRTIPISAPTVLALRELRAAQAEERGQLGPNWTAGDLVFTSEAGAPVDPRNALRAVKVAARKAGLPSIGVHTLRHSAASAMLEAGVPLHTVSEILGHASIQVTGDIYGHVSTEGARSAIDRLAEALGW